MTSAATFGGMGSCKEAAAKFRRDAQGELLSGLGNPATAGSVLPVNSLTNSLIEEIKTAPESVQREVYDFLAFLKARERGDGREDLLPLAESAWMADWNTPEEDAAWRDL